MIRKNENNELYSSIECRSMTNITIVIMYCEYNLQYMQKNGGINYSII